MDQLQLHRAHMLSPFTRYLQSFGAPVERGLARAKLPLACLDNPGMYVASHAFWDFGYRIECKEGIEGLGYLVGEFAGADLVAASFREELEAAPTFYQGMLLLQKKLATETSGTRFKIAHTGSGNLRIVYAISFGPEHPGYNTFIGFGLAGFLEVIRVYTGPDWQPAEIGLRLTRPPGRVLREKLPQTQINITSYNYIDVDTASLGGAPVSLFLNGKELAIPGNESATPDLRRSVQQLLAGYSAQSLPSLELTADFCGISVRTLQRRLSETGSSFRSLVDEAKYQSAACLLQNTSQPIADIARQLGYGNPTHFARAFARMAGVSPLVFRRQQQSK